MIDVFNRTRVFSIIVQFYINPSFSNLVQQLLYKRGYLITNNPVRNLKEFNIHQWNTDTLSEFKIYIDQNLPYIKYKHDDIEIACIGIIIDPVNYLINTEIILENCINYLQKSKNHFWDYIDTLGGRFIIILKDSEELIAFQDAVGIRSLFYYKNDQDHHILLSSHSELIADIMKLQMDKEAVDFMSEDVFKNNADRYYPGLVTPYKEVYSLTPNTYLNLKTKNITRFFPRKNWKSEVGLSSHHDVTRLLVNQLKLLNQHYDLAISLTGGIDSRLTLAASKEIKDSVYYFTTIYGETHQSSIVSSQKAAFLSDTFHLDHHILKYVGKKDPDFLDLFLKNTSHVSTEYRAYIAEILFHRYPENLLHIKSNVVDIAKAHSRRRFAFLPGESNAKVFSKLYGGYNHLHYVNRAMKDYIEITKLKKQFIYDYNLYDLFTWEHRNGKWQSLCLYEWDIVQDTAIIYNNRAILKHFIFQSIREKKKNALHYSLIKIMWPELLKVDIDNDGVKQWKPILRMLKGLSLRWKLIKSSTQA